MYCTTELPRSCSNGPVFPPGWISAATAPLCLLPRGPVSGRILVGVRADPCGRPPGGLVGIELIGELRPVCVPAGGPKPTGGKGEYVNTKFATFGQMGSTLPKQPSGAVWKAGEVVETRWSVRANHGGGWQFRLCPLGSELTEECMQKTPVPFAKNSRMLMWVGTVASG